jgi:hypothetical protein
MTNWILHVDNDTPDGEFLWHSPPGARQVFCNRATWKRLEPAISATTEWRMERGRGGRATMGGNDMGCDSCVVPSWFPPRGETGRI